MRILFIIMLMTVVCLAATAQIKSVRSGAWSDRKTWGGKLPSAKDKIIIGKGFSVIYDKDSSTVSGMQIEGTLLFNQKKTTLLQSNKNIVVTGLLQMRPASVDVIHTLRFVDVDENKIVGGGMDVIETDIGLWVTGDGQLELVGTSKARAWTNAQAGISKGTSTISLKLNPSWLPGDEIVITPTELPTSKTFLQSFDEGKIKAVEGNNIILDRNTIYEHPKVADRWTAEVLNLTRNVRIEGTALGRSHILIRSGKKQDIRWTQIRHMGPRKFRDGAGDKIKDMIPGRYALHFHHSMDGSRGTLVEGNVVRDCGNHAYVPHSSHGITFRNNISYNTVEIAFWWDQLHITHDVIYDSNVVALCNYVFKSRGLGDESSDKRGTTGFLLGMGNGNIIKNNIAVGVMNSDTDHGAAYTWAAENEGMWEFENNLAHNGGTGIRVWQNTGLPHVIRNFNAYNNKLGVFHGAYANSYRYIGGMLYGNAFELKAAAAAPYRLRIEEMMFDGAKIIDYPLRIAQSALSRSTPVLIRSVQITNYRKAAVSYEMETVEKVIKPVDFIQSDLGGNPFAFVNPMLPGDMIRVQPLSGIPYQITDQGKINIREFAPTIWGNGTGLKAEYFNNKDLNNPVLTIIDPVIHYTTLKEVLNYRISNDESYSIRWSGMVMPQFSEPITFYIESGGGHRLWVNDKLILESWADHHPREYISEPVLLKAGEKYGIKLEYFNGDDNISEASLKWSSSRLPKEVVPQSQLFQPEIDTTGGYTLNSMSHPKQPQISEKVDEKVSIYPNPSTGLITIEENHQDLSNTTIEVLSNDGAKVFEYLNRSEGDVQLNLSHLKTGSYFIYIKGISKPIIQRILIAH